MASKEITFIIHQQRDCLSNITLVDLREYTVGPERGTTHAQEEFGEMYTFLLKNINEQYIVNTERGHCLFSIVSGQFFVSDTFQNEFTIILPPPPPYAGHILTLFQNQIPTTRINEPNI